MNESMNRFDRNNAKRAAQRTAAHWVSRADAAAARDKQRESWTKHGHSRPQGGLLLDQRVLSAKAAALADRMSKNGSPALTVMTDRSIAAIVERWVQETGFYSSEFNQISLRNRLREQVDAGIPFSYEMLNETNDWLRRNNYLEQPPQTTRKRGEIVSSAAPRLYEYIPADEQAAIDAELAAKAVANRATEDAENKNLPLDELRRRVAAGRGTVSRESLRIYQG